MKVNMKSRDLFSDLSLWFLLFANIVIIFFALSEGWDLLTVMWIYWFQSMIIGIFNFIRILQLKEVSTKRVQKNKQSTQTTQGIKILIAFWFLSHYSFFHSVFLEFLTSDLVSNTSLISDNEFENSQNIIEWKYIFLMTLLFFLNHLYSYFYNRPGESKKQSLGSLMFYPYARIIPMHFTIALGSILGGALLIFLILKTLADATAHMVEHKALWKGELQEV